MQFCKRYEKTNLRVNRGFTLIEILTVVLIIAILLGLTFGLYPYIKRQIREKKAISQIQHIKTALEEYKISNGSYPTPTVFQAETFRASLPSGFTFDGSENPLDPWGNPYVYSDAGGMSYTLFCLGNDGQNGTEETDADNIQ